MPARIVLLMEPTEGHDIDAMDCWQLPSVRNQPIVRRQSGWNFAILAVVVMLHVGLIAYVFSLRTFVNGNVVADEALQVTFIDRILPTTEESSPSARVTKRPIDKNRSASTPAGKQEAFAREESKADMPVSTLRLTLDNDEWQPALLATPDNPLKKKYIALPGRAEPFVEGIKMAGTRSPRQKLAMVGKLFGAVDHDPCDEARKRIASGRSQVDEIDLEADLRSIELHCR